MTTQGIERCRMARVRGAAVQGREVVWSNVFKAMGDRTRLSILLTLLKGEQCVTDLAKGLKMDGPKVSFHLAKLKNAGLLTQERQAQRVIYRIKPELRKEASDDMSFDVDGCVVTFQKR